MISSFHFTSKWQFWISVNPKSPVKSEIEMFLADYDWYVDEDVRITKTGKYICMIEEAFNDWQKNFWPNKCYVTYRHNLKEIKEWLGENFQDDEYVIGHGHDDEDGLPRTTCWFRNQSDLIQYKLTWM